MIELTFVLELSEKEADDLALSILTYLQETHDVLVSDYRISNE